MNTIVSFLTISLFLAGVSLESAESPTIVTPETEQRIDAALNSYYNGRTEEAEKIIQELKNFLPADPFVREMAAEIIWKKLNKKTRSDSYNEDSGVNMQAVRENWNLVENFYGEIDYGLSLTQKTLSQNGMDSKNIFISGMLLTRKGGFMAKFEGPKSYGKADKITAEGLALIQKSIALDSSLCSAKYLFAISKYEMIKNSSEWYKNLAMRWWSNVFVLLNADFDMRDVFNWLSESMQCRSDYYYTKDVIVDKKFVFQEILVKQAGRMDETVLPVLLELNAKFPENTVIRDNLFLVQFHLRNRGK